MRKSDHASMKASKELRSPYLQNDVNDFTRMNNFFSNLFPPHLPGNPSTPPSWIVAVGGELIGGCDITLDLYESGKLKEMMEATQKS